MDGGSALPWHLSKRELTVLELMAQGWSNAGIERSLWVSTKTVETHVRSIYLKLGLPPATDEHRRVRAVLMYLQANSVEVSVLRGA